MTRSERTFSNEFAAPINNFLVLSLCPLTYLLQKVSFYTKKLRYSVDMII